MTLDFSGLNILSRFLALIDSSRLQKGIDSDAITQSQHSSTKLENSLGCNLCGISEFSSLQDFKEHRKSLEHLCRQTEVISLSQDNSRPEIPNPNVPNSPNIKINWSNTQLGIYKLVIMDKSDELYKCLSTNCTYELFQKLSLFLNSSVLIVLNGGGYFAAAIFDNKERKLTCSKTLKRYTTRRKQGGSQVLKDNASSGKIHSAGAMIRRENEKKLRLEISEVLQNWRPLMEQCSVIFCNRDAFLLEALQDLGSVRTVPFTTYQACFEEVSRCYCELLSSIKIENIG